jgi:hypothetical protein
MPISTNILEDSLISSIIFFLKKIIFQKFGHLILELIYAELATWLQ